jgi:MFS family permease
VSGFLFARQLLDAAEQTMIWTVIFFFASSAAGSAYLTVSETFPVEIRALAIAIFFAAGTAVGRVGAPFLFGILVQSGSRDSLFAGYLLGAGLGRCRRTKATRTSRAAPVVGTIKDRL